MVALLAITLAWAPDWWLFDPGLTGRPSLFHEPIENLRLYLPAAVIIGVVAGGSAVRMAAATIAGGGPSVVRLVAVIAVAVAEMTPVALTGLTVLESGLGRTAAASVGLADWRSFELVAVIATFAAVLVWALRPDAAPNRGDDGGSRDWREFHRRPMIIGAVVVMALFVTVGLLAPWIQPHRVSDYTVGDPDEGFAWTHLLGTQYLGQDILSRCLAATRTALVLCGEVIAFGCVPGALIGVLASRWERGRAILPAIAGAWLSIPALLIVFVAVLPMNNSSWCVIVAASASAFALALRAGTLADPSNAHLVMRRFLGAGAVACALAITLQSTASYLGFGYGPGSVTWGRELHDALHFPLHGHAILAPTAFWTLAVFGFLLLRAALDDDVPPLPCER
jgi:ABC-type dipeptide/oligopeptide/nickel transport system permease subunit